LTQSYNRDIKNALRRTSTIRRVIAVLLVIRHAQKGPDGNLTVEGVRSAQDMGLVIRKDGYVRAVTAPNVRSIQTAEAAGLEVVGECSSLGIPNDYEAYMNGPVVERMLAQPGSLWEKSYTRAVLEDDQFDTFYYWGLSAAREVRHYALEERKLVMIGSSPLIELAYLIIANSLHLNWEDFARCRELEGFFCTPHHGRYAPYITCRQHLKL
jgi:hypothetical protein